MYDISERLRNWFFCSSVNIAIVLDVWRSSLATDKFSNQIFLARFETTSFRFPGLFGNAFSVRKIPRFHAFFVENDDDDEELPGLPGVRSPAFFLARYSFDLSASASHLALNPSGSFNFRSKYFDCLIAIGVYSSLYLFDDTFCNNPCFPN